MSDPSPTGGAVWEFGEAWKLIVAAKLAKDLPGEKLGWIRLSEAVNNGASSASAAQLIPMLLEVRQIRDDRKTDAASSEHLIMGLLKLAEQEQSTQAGQDVQLGLHDMRLTAIERAAAIALIAATLAETETQILRAQVEALSARVGN